MESWFAYREVRPKILYLDLVGFESFDLRRQSRLSVGVFCHDFRSHSFARLHRDSGFGYRIAVHVGFLPFRDHLRSRHRTPKHDQVGLCYLSYFRDPGSLGLFGCVLRDHDDHVDDLESKARPRFLPGAFRFCEPLPRRLVRNQARLAFFDLRHVWIGVHVLRYRRDHHALGLYGGSPAYDLHWRSFLASLRVLPSLGRNLRHRLVAEPVHQTSAVSPRGGRDAFGLRSNLLIGYLRHGDPCLGIFVSLGLSNHLRSFSLRLFLIFRVEGVILRPRPRRGIDVVDLYRVQLLSRFPENHSFAVSCPEIRGYVMIDLSSFLRSFDACRSQAMTFQTLLKRLPNRQEVPGRNLRSMMCPLSLALVIRRRFGQWDPSDLR